MRLNYIFKRLSEQLLSESITAALQCTENIKEDVCVGRIIVLMHKSAHIQSEKGKENISSG